MLEIRYGKSFAVMVDPSLVKKLTSQYPELRVLSLPLKIEDVCLGNGICLRKDNAVLIQEMQKAVDELTLEGKVLDLEQKWKIGGS